MSSPSALLVAAADRIRDLAAAATPGPWRQHDGWWPGTLGVVASVLSGEGNDVSARALLPTFESEPNTEARNVWNDARWIAALSPAVAPALEALLRQSTAMWTLWEGRGLPWDETCRKVGQAPVAAYELARVIVPELAGEQP